MTKRNQHVVPHDDGWAVRSAGSQRASSLHRTQSEAVNVGREARDDPVRDAPLAPAVAQGRVCGTLSTHEAPRGSALCSRPSRDGGK